MSNQPNTNTQPTTPTFPCTPVPPGPVPAPAPRQAGDIPDPPLSAACSSKAKGGTVFDVVTDKIISLLEQGTAPWRADWVRAAKTADVPRHRQTLQGHQPLSLVDDLPNERLSLAILADFQAGGGAWWKGPQG